MGCNKNCHKRQFIWYKRIQKRGRPCWFAYHSTDHTAFTNMFNNKTNWKIRLFFQSKINVCYFNSEYDSDWSPHRHTWLLIKLVNQQKNSTSFIVSLLINRLCKNLSISFPDKIKVNLNSILSISLKFLQELIFLFTYLLYVYYWAKLHTIMKPCYNNCFTFLDRLH